MRHKYKKEKELLRSIGKNVNLSDKVITYMFKKHTIRVYKLGLNDAFYWNNKNVFNGKK